MERSIMENKSLDIYVKPQMVILEVELQQMIAFSTIADGGQEEDGNAEINRYRRGTWGNLWE